ncbi:Sphingosine N-acyltransferase lag1 [Hypsizygus marmoreus]|uniref:Sphingosine N-acyltransferase lag1 n=1 Tax=Hypsizygus marmoreus TaxID=39966 RepID=A0A369JQF3_HYPMA|nr:Sphingosine N-acyltransferase lag1 [Hypsizygus marmoreus]
MNPQFSMDALFTTEWLHPYMVPFLSLSYPTATPQNPDSFHDHPHYITGLQDLCLIVTCIAIMAILRDALRLGVFEPFARWKLSRDLYHRKKLEWASEKGNGTANGVANGNAKANGHSNGSAKAATNGNGVVNGVAQPTARELRQMHRSVLRFAEQGWSVVYYTLQWSFGLYLHRKLPTRLFDPSDLWEGYPHIPIPGPLKFYYLTQTAFYIHQALILNAEARRKDHVQMMTHHVISIFLMATSYFSNFTRVGCLIMVLMDWCDIFLPLAKMIRYIEISQIACDLTFVWFLVSWFITRHVFFNFAIVSTFTDLPRLVPFAWLPEEGRYLSKSAWIVFCTLLTALQVLQVIWFGMICRVAWRVITTDKGASDDRSDDEGDDKEN